MTDRPMDADATEHPDEGAIHAWLDDALDAAEAERLAAHVRSCPECQARVAEARGLIAGASRIVAALDDVPAGTRPQWAQSVAAEGGAAGVAATTAAEPMAQRSLWRWLRVTPGRAALAATILVAVGITLTYQRAAIESTPRSAAAVLNPQKTDVPASTSPEGAASDAAKPRDEILDSAVAKNVAIAQGRRAIGAAPGPAIPAAPPPSIASQAPAAGAGAGAGAAVARGRAAAEAQRESTVVAADRYEARRPPRTVTGATATIAGGRADGATMAQVSADAVASRCFRIDSPDSDARWADQPFPLVIALDSAATTAGRRSAAVLTVAGEPTQLRATWIPRGDSVLVRLGRIGYSGMIALGPDAGARSGLAVSAVAPSALEEVVVEPPANARAAVPRADAARAEAAAPARPTPPGGPPVRQLRVTARAIPCPSR